MHRRRCHRGSAAPSPRVPRGRGDGLRVVGIVHRILAVGTHVNHLEMLGGQERFHRLLQLEAGMIRTDGHSHWITHGVQHHSGDLFAVLHRVRARAFAPVSTLIPGTMPRLASTCGSGVPVELSCPSGFSLRAARNFRQIAQPFEGAWTASLPCSASASCLRRSRARSSEPRSPG